MARIVVFDSGFGSLSVIKQIRKKMKAEVIYFADQKNYPYGKKSVSQLRKIVNETISFLDKEFEPDVIVVGSNTPTILLGGYKSSKVIGVYPPLKEASTLTKSSSIGILTTQNVAKSKQLSRLIKKNVPKNVTVRKINASSLLDLVESGKFIYNKQYCKHKINSLLANYLHKNNIDVVTLSSTHLPFLLPYLNKLFPKTSFLDPAQDVVKKILNKKSGKKSSLKIYCSGNIRLFQQQLNKIGIKRNVQKLEISHC
jgi:glutamate racemase